MAEVKKRRGAGRAGAGHLQRLPDCHRGRLLPGTLMRNEKLKFICGDVHLKVETSQSLFTNRYQAGQVIKVPVAHAEGNYFADEDTLKKLEDRGQIAFRYCKRPTARSTAAAIPTARSATSPASSTRPRR